MAKKDGLCDECRDEEDSLFKNLFGRHEPKGTHPNREVIDENVKRNKP